MYYKLTVIFIRINALVKAGYLVKSTRNSFDTFNVKRQYVIIVRDGLVTKLAQARIE